MTDLYLMKENIIYLKILRTDDESLTEGDIRMINRIIESLRRDIDKLENKTE